MNRMKTTASVLTAMTVSSFIFAGTGYAEDQWQRNHRLAQKSTSASDARTDESIRVCGTAS